MMQFHVANLVEASRKQATFIREAKSPPG